MRRIFLACMLLTAFLLPVGPISAFADDYSLDEAFRTALRNSEKIRLSEENVVIAETTRQKAWAVLIPKLTAYGGQTWYSGKKTTSTGTLIQPDEGSPGGRADQHVPDGPEVTALASPDNKDMSRMVYPRGTYVPRRHPLLMSSRRKSRVIADANL